VTIYILSLFPRLPLTISASFSPSQRPLVLCSPHHGPHRLFRRMSRRRTASTLKPLLPNASGPKRKRLFDQYLTSDCT
jgi:hypothetical protein